MVLKVIKIMTVLTNEMANQEWVDFDVNTIRAVMTRDVVGRKKQMSEVEKEKTIVSNLNERACTSTTKLTHSMLSTRFACFIKMRLFSLGAAVFWWEM